MVIKWVALVFTLLLACSWHGVLQVLQGSRVWAEALSSAVVKCSPWRFCILWLERHGRANGLWRDGADTGKNGGVALAYPCWFQLSFLGRLHCSYSSTLLVATELCGSTSNNDV